MIVAVIVEPIKQLLPQVRLVTGCSVEVPWHTGNWQHYCQMFLWTKLIPTIASLNWY